MIQFFSLSHRVILLIGDTIVSKPFSSFFASRLVIQTVSLYCEEITNHGKLLKSTASTKNAFANTEMRILGSEGNLNSILYILINSVHKLNLRRYCVEVFDYLNLSAVSI